MKSKPTKKVNFKNELFCKEFIIDLNGKAAAIRAGYLPHSAKVTASRLLTNANLRMRIIELMDERSKRTMVDADFVVRNLIEVNGRCLQALPVMEFDPAIKRKVQKTDSSTGSDVWQFDSNGANRALELLGRHLGMFTDKSSITVVNEQPLFS